MTSYLSFLTRITLNFLTMSEILLDVFQASVITMIELQGSGKIVVGAGRDNEYV
jgi:hypothetical protein